VTPLMRKGQITCCLEFILDVLQLVRSTVKVQSFVAVDGSIAAACLVYASVIAVVTRATRPTLMKKVISSARASPRSSSSPW
jgi:hypothetical protein